MILNKQDIEQGTSYSYIISKKENISLVDLIDVANLMLVPLGEITENEALPSELALLKDISLNLNDRMREIARITNKLNENQRLNCEEITIVDYGCGQGLASLSLLDWFTKNDLIKSIKQIKLVDNNKNSLKRALLHYSILFPEIDVIAFEQDFLDLDFAVECNSVLTINIFSHLLGSEPKLVDHIKNLILKGHNLLMHNIILDEIASPSYPSKIKPNYLLHTIHSIKNYTGCEQIAGNKFTLQERNNTKEKIKIFQYAVLSRLNVSQIKIPKTENRFQNLYPGEPRRTLYNVPQRVLWFERPLENTAYCQNLDDINKISLYDNYISPLFLDTWSEKADELNPKTIKDCAEKFHQGHILHALNCNLPCGQEIVELYEKAAKDGITEAYNNLAILQFQKRLEDENASQEAVVYSKLAANGGSDSAMMNLASYFMDKGLEDIAISYYKSASEKDNEVALFNLAIIKNFGIYNQDIDLDEAEKLYRKSLNAFNKKEKQEWPDSYILNTCCLNLMLLLESKGEHFLKILDVYSNVKNPSNELKYCFEVLQIKHINSFSKDVITTLELNNSDESEKTYKKFNRAIFLYNGLLLKDSDIKFEKDKDKALEIMNNLSVKENHDWADSDKYVDPLFALWTNSNKDKFGNLSEYYWRLSADNNPERACAYLTNMAISCDISEEEKKSIWKRFAFADGCNTCHECANYDNKEKICPKAQFNWAKNYETDKDLAQKLILRSAEQHFDKAFFYLGFEKPAEECDFPQHESEEFYSYLAKDCYFNYLQASADCGLILSQALMLLVSKKRSSKYNYIYWASVMSNENENITLDIRHDILNFFQSICKRSFKKFFEAKTICEKQMLEIADIIAEKTNDIGFINTLASFYHSGGDIVKYINLLKIAGPKQLQNFIKTKPELLKNDKVKEDIFKEEKDEILQVLRDNNINSFYHFTDRKNIASIKELGGLYSWKYLENKGIKINNPGGGDVSRALDRRYGLQDYVRLSFCPDHPMAYKLIQSGVDVVVLKISIEVATFKTTLFSDMNATDNSHSHGPNLKDLKKVNFSATQRRFVSKEDPLFKALQAEVMVKTFIPINLITNISEF